MLSMSIVKVTETRCRTRWTNNVCWRVNLMMVTLRRRVHVVMVLQGDVQLVGLGTTRVHLVEGML